MIDKNQFRGHEQLAYFHDKESGLKAFIAVHDTSLGPAAGGCRVWPYESEMDALNDVLRLSRGMRYKMQWPVFRLVVVRRLLSQTQKPINRMNF